MRLFEVGRRYLAEEERATAALLLAGDKAPRHWQSGKAQGHRRVRRQGRDAGLARSRGRAGRRTSNCSWTPGRPGIRGARRGSGLGPKTIVAAFGELHPRIAKALDLPAGTVAAELYLDAIPAPRNSERARVAFAPPPLQAVTRDFAFVVPADLAADALTRAHPRRRQGAITAVRLFDRYEGEQGLEPGVRSHAAAGREELHRSRDCRDFGGGIVAAAAKLGATLRG